MMIGVAEARERLEGAGQGHVLRHWESLNTHERAALLQQVADIDFALINRLVRQWVLATPEPERFRRIEPAPVISRFDSQRADHRAYWAAGEDALRKGRVGLVLVAGGQGTRLGYPGPKGCFPIGPVTGKSLFAYHADKIHNLQRRYGCSLPWYIMVGESNERETVHFFEKQDYFGLKKSNVYFFKQAMMPCVDDRGKLMLEAPGRLATNPNGHGGSLPAMVECGVTRDARERGIDTLSYFQVDNWAAKVADPFFIGCHVARGGRMSSKAHRKHEPRESVGVFCVCDGELRVIEYTELDLYPQLLETDEEGDLVHYPGNAAIHVLDVGFVERVAEQFDEFPWHCSHKKIPYCNETGERVQPSAPNGYKFETFVFDALRYTGHGPIVLEIPRAGEYTPIKQLKGPNSVEEARASMNSLWREWLKAAGCPAAGDGAVVIEISPRFALTREEFLAKSTGLRWPSRGPIVIDDEGRLV